MTLKKEEKQKTSVTVKKFVAISVRIGTELS